MVTTNIFFEVLYLPQEDGSKLACSDGVGDSNKLLLKVP
jgi:hypothetical protein